MSKAKPYIAKQPQKLQYKSIQGTLLYLFLVPLFLAVILALFQTNIQAFLLNGISFFLFLAVSKLAKKGFSQEALYHTETFTKAPSIPYKMYAGYLLGGATFFTAYLSGGQPLLKALFLALIATIGYYLLYGFDPKADKLNNLGDISAEFVLQTLKDAEDKLKAIEEDMLAIHNQSLQKKIQNALLKAKHIVRTIEEDPKDIRVARKFLIVYVEGIAKVTDAYTQMDESDIDPHTQTRLHTLMDEVDTRLEKELKRLKANNAFDLDVHIDTLKEQIKS